MDGSSFEGLTAGGFAVLGTLALLDDLEPWEKRGTERPASDRLLRRLVEREGKGCLERLAAEGLAATRDFFRFCQEELGCHGVVKTEEETLTLRQDADGLFAAAPRLQEGIEYVEGGDAQRALQYRSWAASGFEWEGLAAPLRIARVGEEPLKGPPRGETSLFYVLTTDLSLSARELREGAHARGREANNGFKALNEQAHAKHAFVPPGDRSREGTAGAGPGLGTDCVSILAPAPVDLVGPSATSRGRLKGGAPGGVEREFLPVLFYRSRV